MSNAVMGLRLKQQLTLTPRLQQSVKLLQLSALECVQELHQAIAQNPFLEEAAENGSDTETREEGSSSDESSRSELDFSGQGSGSQGGMLWLLMAATICRARGATSLYSIRLKGASSPGRSSAPRPAFVLLLALISAQNR